MTTRHNVSRSPKTTRLNHSQRFDCKSCLHYICCIISHPAAAFHFVHWTKKKHSNSLQREFLPSDGGVVLIQEVLRVLQHNVGLPGLDSDDVGQHHATGADLLRAVHHLLGEDEWKQNVSRGKSGGIWGGTQKSKFTSVTPGPHTWFCEIWATLKLVTRHQFRHANKLVIFFVSRACFHSFVKPFLWCHFSKQTSKHMFA